MWSNYWSFMDTLIANKILSNKYYWIPFSDDFTLNTCVTKVNVHLLFDCINHYFYRPRTKYDGRLYFQFVCHLTPTGGGLPHLHPIILPLVPFPFWGGGAPYLHPIILLLVPCPFWAVSKSCAYAFCVLSVCSVYDIRRMISAASCVQAGGLSCCLLILPLHSTEYSKQIACN